MPPLSERVFWTSEGNQAAPSRVLFLLDGCEKAEGSPGHSCEPDRCRSRLKPFEHTASSFCVSWPSSAPLPQGCGEDPVKHHLISGRHPFFLLPPLGGSLALRSTVSLGRFRSHLGWFLAVTHPGEAGERLANTYQLTGPPAPTMGESPVSRPPWKDLPNQSSGL